MYERKQYIIHSMILLCNAKIKLKAPRAKGLLSWQKWIKSIKGDSLLILGDLFKEREKLFVMKGRRKINSI